MIQDNEKMGIQVCSIEYILAFLKVEFLLDSFAAKFWVTKRMDIMPGEYPEGNQVAQLL